MTYHGRLSVVLMSVVRGCDADVIAGAITQFSRGLLMAERPKVSAKSGP